MIGLMDFLQDPNHFMHVLPILAAGVFAAAVVVERWYALYRAYPLKREEEFFDRIQELVMGGKVAEAVALCDKHAGQPAAHVVKCALLRAHQPESLIENGVDIAVEEAVQKVQKRTHFLGMIANVATLLGLLGTIFGLVQSFYAVGVEGSANKATILAQGISTALNATILGLAVAVPCMVAFSFLMNRAQRLISQVEISGVRSIDILRQRVFAAELKAVPPTDGKGSHKGAA